MDQKVSAKRWTSKSPYPPIELWASIAQNMGYKNAYPGCRKTGCIVLIFICVRCRHIHLKDIKSVNSPSPDAAGNFTFNILPKEYLRREHNAISDEKVLPSFSTRTLKFKDQSANHYPHSTNDETGIFLQYVHWLLNQYVTNMAGETDCAVTILICIR